MVRAIFIILLLGAAAHAGGGTRTYKNDRWGYRLRVPADFKTAALSASEEWIASKHVATRMLYAKRSVFLEADYPHVWVIGFPHQRQEERGAKVKREEDKTTITFKNPYKDYKDFIKRERWFVGGGYYFSKEEEGENAGMSVTKYEIKVEKMVESPYRIVTWVYHFDDIDFAVQCKILEDYYKKYRGLFRSCLKSFRRIERTRALPGAVTTGRKIVDVEDEKKLSSREKMKRRKERFEVTLKRETDALPKDWYVLRSEHHVALSNGSRKFTKQVLGHAEAIRGYLDKTFGRIGDDYVPPGILRVFATDAELNAYRATTNMNWLDWVEQVAVSEEYGKLGRKTWAMESVSGGVTRQWLSYKNRLLSDNLPFWFRAGLQQHMRFARVKGKSVTIKPDEYDRGYVKKIIKEGKAVEIRSLFLQGDDEYAYNSQSGSVVSWLLTKGSRGKAKDLVQNYLVNLVAAIQEAEAEYQGFLAKQKEEAEKGAVEMREPEESEEESGEEDDEGEKSWERFREAMKKRVKSIRENAFQRTFGHFSAKDWQRLDRAWRAYAG